MTRLLHRSVAATAAVLVLGLTLLWPSASAACPNCYASIETQVVRTYYLSAAILTLLPFVIVGGFVLLVRSWQRREGVTGEP